MLVDNCCDPRTAARGGHLHVAVSSRTRDEHTFTPSNTIIGAASQRNVDTWLANVHVYVCKEQLPSFLPAHYPTFACRIRQSRHCSQIKPRLVFSYWLCWVCVCVSGGAGVDVSSRSVLFITSTAILVNRPVVLHWTPIRDIVMTQNDSVEFVLAKPSSVDFDCHLQPSGLPPLPLHTFEKCNSTRCTRKREQSHSRINIITL